MSTRQDSAPAPIVRSRDDLVAWIAAGSKPTERWRIGTEHEKFLFATDTLRPVPYDGPNGVRALMEGLIARFGWEPIMEGTNLIALKRPAAEGALSATVSLEPGGQFELSGAPVRTVHDTGAETHEHLEQVLAVGGPLRIGFLGVGFSPNWTLDETPRMPKQRYQVMTRYMPLVGKRGLDMMYRTATIQVNLDFADEADMVRKFRVSLALQPVVTAIFACSPFTEGRPNGFLSMRSEVWRDTDRARTGMLPFVFEPGMGFERYVDYALDVPMYFVYRDGRYIDAAGASFRDFLAGRLPQLSGELPTEDDWSDHLTTLFPEVRMKRFLEMRGADGGRWRRICALPALWSGLLYDRAALDAAWELVKDWTAEERQALRDGVPKTALRTKFRTGTVLDVARQALAIAEAGLQRRAFTNAKGEDERIFLEPVAAILREGMTPADEILLRYERDWNRRTGPLFTDYAF
ncbi:MAG TPA: glutamate--cysteine ligase [Hyphomicrobiaceae bacterium]|jgi:glutamate--cysteine ligase|nr:glutamate--cysteine ligase [Hyphomicrobiaceae bacterium]